MIDLAALGALAAELPPGGPAPVATLQLGDRVVDTDASPLVIGVVNLSADSTYRDSVALTTEAAVRRGVVLAAQGADVVDLGAESTDARHERTTVGGQLDRLLPVVRALTERGVLVSVESYDVEVVAAALSAGARVVNLTGSDHDDAVFRLAAEHRATVVVCHLAGPDARNLSAAAVSDAHAGLDRRTAQARECGVDNLVLDPGIGFGLPSAVGAEDRLILQGAAIVTSFRLRTLGHPVCQSLPHAFVTYEDQYRTAEGLFAALALIGGAGVLRTHEVAQVRAVARTLRLLHT